MKAIERTASDGSVPPYLAQMMGLFLHCQPLLIVLAVPDSARMWAVSGSALLFLALLGAIAARAGGASVMTAATRVTFWGALAMALTAGVGALFGVTA